VQSRKADSAPNLDVAPLLEIGERPRRLPLGEERGAVAGLDTQVLPHGRRPAALRPRRRWPTDGWVGGGGGGFVWVGRGRAGRGRLT
jgi:hypothetical protein